MPRFSFLVLYNPLVCAMPPSIKTLPNDYTKSQITTQCTLACRDGLRAGVGAADARVMLGNPTLSRSRSMTLEFITTYNKCSLSQPIQALPGLLKSSFGSKTLLKIKMELRMILRNVYRQVVGNAFLIQRFSQLCFPLRHSSYLTAYLWLL